MSHGKNCYGQWRETRAECRRCELGRWCSQPDAKDPPAIGIREVKQGCERNFSEANIVWGRRKAVCQPVEAFLALLVRLADRHDSDGLLLPVVILRLSGVEQVDIAKRLRVTRQAVSKRLLAAADEFPGVASLGVKRQRPAPPRSGNAGR